MPTLREKFRGCVAATWVGSAMGAAVEGWSPEEIRKEHGLLEELLPYKHYTHVTDWLRPPGTTEDGIERQRLVATAIIEKRGRILAHDLVRVWLRDLDPGKVKYKQEAFDLSLLEMARVGVPPSELGKLWPFPNVVSVSRATHPLGLINAGDPKGAADDTFEVGKVYARETTACLRWAAMYNACIAEACRPAATVESVLATAREFAAYRAEGGGLFSRYDSVEREVERALEIASRHTGRDSMREEFYRHYRGGAYICYGGSQANEIVSKGLAVFALSGGDPREAIVTAVNFGRDTDCLAAIAGGLAGTLSGAEAVPPQWREQVDAATKEDPYTNSRRTIDETADGLHEAFASRLSHTREWFEEMGAEGVIA